jgi:hypothetical protein
MSVHRQWRWPLALALLTVAGLVAALLGEGGLWWPTAWAALAAPLAVAAWAVWRPR